MGYPSDIVKLPPKKALSKTHQAYHKTFDQNGLFLHFRQSCCPPRCQCPSSFPTIYHLYFHRKKFHPHSTSHRTSFSENLVVAIFKFPQKKAQKCSHENAKKFSVQAQDTSKMEVRDLFFQNALWVLLSSQAAINLFTMDIQVNIVQICTIRRLVVLNLKLAYCAFFVVSFKRCRLR